MAVKNLKKLKLTKKSLLVGLLGALIGIFLVLVVRFITYNPEEVHYHANFAIYINGQRQQFKEPFYYEAVTACTLDRQITPIERVHMHDQVNNVVHVHAHGVAWGHFFQNLGWYVGPDLVKTPQKTYSPDNQNKTTFVLNGEKMSTVTNLVIGDKDKLLVDFGNTSDQTLQAEYKSVSSTAAKYDAAQDPKSCSGRHEPTFRDRLEQLF